MIDLEIMRLGYLASQKKRIEIGNYIIKFHRRKIKNMDYMYSIEVYFRGELKHRGFFAEYQNAVMHAGKIMYALL